MAQEAGSLRVSRLPPGVGRLVVLLAVLAVGGCSLAYNEGRLRESQNRWEEAAIQYHLAYIGDPQDGEYREAFLRASKQVARENMERYKDYLGNKEFGKAYQRLVDASRQDPDLEPAKRESARWMRVLVGGQIKLEFSDLQADTSLADEIRVVVRLNTPNPGEVIEAEVDVDTGVFYAENLLYDRPDELLAYYSVNSIGLSLVQGKTKVKQFSNHEFVRFITFRTPILASPLGPINLPSDGVIRRVAEHRRLLQNDDVAETPIVPRSNPKYQMTVQGDRILVTSGDGRSDFTPRYLYVNKQDRRLFVDFGRYEVQLLREGRGWGMARLPVGRQDYVPVLAGNVALQPYFYYRGAVLTYLPAKEG
jgi:hypothetical protein